MSTSAPMAVDSVNGIPTSSDGVTESPRFLVDVAHTMNVLLSGDL
jgi:hypothetical protein